MDPLKQFTRVVVAAVAVSGLGAAVTLLATGLSAATVVTVVLVAVFVTVTTRFAIRRTKRTETPYW